MILTTRIIYSLLRGSVFQIQIIIRRGCYMYHDFKTEYCAACICSGHKRSKHVFQALYFKIISTEDVLSKLSHQTHFVLTLLGKFVELNKTDFCH